MWCTVLLFTGKVFVLYRSGGNVYIHMVNEFFYSALLIVSGILLLLKKKIASKLNYLALGMLLYATINAAGYYFVNDRGMFAMFVVVISLTVLLIVFSLIFERKESGKQGK